jgi:hypothetical protein
VVTILAAVACVAQPPLSPEPTDVPTVRPNRLILSVLSFAFEDQAGGGYQNLKGYDGGEVVFDEPVMASGVYVVVVFAISNISDSTFYVNESDFRIVVKDGLSYGISEEATQSYVRNRKYGVGRPSSADELNISTRPVTTTRMNRHYDTRGGIRRWVVFRDEPVKVLRKLYILGIFDIPRSGFERTLALTHNDGGSVRLQDPLK